MQFLQPHDLALRERFVAEVGQRWTLPQRQCLPERLGGLRRGSGGQSFTPEEDQLLELAHVQLVREQPQYIARCPGNEASRWEHPPQSRNRSLKRIRRAGRGVLAPQIDQELFARHYLVRAQQQADQHGTLADPAHRDASATVL